MKLKEHKYHDLPRQSRLARLLWPSGDAADPIDREIQQLAAGEGRKAPQPAKLLGDAVRGAV